MRYLLTIYHDENAMAARSPEEGAEIGARCGRTTSTPARGSTETRTRRARDERRTV